MNVGGNMVYTCKYKSLIGDILLAADEIGLTGLWFEGQKYFANTLPEEHISQETSILTDAKKWLDEHKITYEDRHIIDRNPSVEELTEWIKRSKLPLKNFFNTSGLVYKEMKLKDKLPAMSEAEQIALLASDGKLIKRPLLISEDQVLVGFKADEWNSQVK